MMFEQQNLKPSSKFNTFMDKFALPIVVLVIGTPLATLIGAVLLGKIQILDFNWVMLVLGIIMAAIMGYFVWYYLKTRREYQEQYEKNIAELRQEVKAAKDEYWKLVQDNTQLSEEWRENFRRAYAQEQQERLETVRNEFQQAIADAKEELRAPIQNRFSNLDIWITEHTNAHKWEQKSYKHQLEALEEKLTRKQLSESGN
jgi:type II secretory pathway pseudopilin PulG